MFARIFLLALCAAMLAPCPAAARSGNDPLHPACEIAKAFAQGVIAGSESPLIFTGERFEVVDFLESGWWREGADPPVHVPPPHDLLARLNLDGHISAVQSCASLRLFLAARGIAYGREAARDRRRGSRREQDAAYVVSITLPVVSEDGRRALLAYADTGAGASLRLLERQADGRWRVVAYQPLAVY